jgi:hypothetical protein
MHSEKGPWGQIEYFQIQIEAPIELIKANQPTSFRTRWFFEKQSTEQVHSFFSTLNLSPELFEKLTNRERWQVEPGGVIIFPHSEDVLALSTESRTALYRVLGRWSENPYHVEPEVLEGESVDDWLKGYAFSDDSINFIRKTTYKYGSTLLFADTPALMGIARNEEERIQLLRALTRTPSIVAKLLLKSGSMEELSTYWQRGFRTRDVSTFIESLKRYEDIERIDLMHLLPPNVRKILNTFPDPTLTRSGYLPDCHWSSLNFFNSDPLERLCDPPQATAYTLENFTPVSAPYELGDVLFFTDTQSGDAYHSCTYIADDIVFTKNGRSPLEPWVLMKLDKVKGIYDLHFKTNITAYRRKGLSSHTQEGSR